MSCILTKKLTAALLALSALTLGACGGKSNDDTSTGATRTMNVDMRDISFSPDHIAVKAGQKVRFVFHNRGKVTHDAFIGDVSAQDDHEMEMRGSSTTGADAGMGHGSMADEGGITVEPGKTGEFTHTFKAGDHMLIGCHQAGHYAGGMKMTIDVT